jgi:cobalt/nickel transport system permease protein
MISMDQYAYRSKLKHKDPLQKLAFAFMTLSVCLWANHGLISVMVIFTMGGMTVLRGGTPLRFFIKLLLIPMSFLLIGIFTIAVNVSEMSEGFLAAIPVAGTWIGFSRTGLQDALQLFLKALGTVSCLYFLSLTTPMMDLLSALRRLGVPKILVEIMGLVYRFIFILLETADTMYKAQSCRLGYSSLFMRYHSLGSLASMLFMRAYKRSDELYTALEARGYEGELKVLGETYENHWSGYALAILVNTLLVLLAVALKWTMGGSH